MKNALLVLMVLVIVPFAATTAHAQVPPEKREIAIEVGGPNVGGTGINGLAVGWSLTRDHRNVSIAAHLTNGGGTAGYAGGTAYLTRKIGPLSGTVDEVAKTQFELPDFYNGMFTLFENLDLAAGQYWLVFEDPKNGRFTYATWLASMPFAVMTSKSARYLGTTSYLSARDISFYMPRTIFKEPERRYGYQFEVIGEPVPLLKDEDPGRATLR